MPDIRPASATSHLLGLLSPPLAPAIAGEAALATLTWPPGSFPEALEGLAGLLAARNGAHGFENGDSAARPSRT